MRPSAGQLALLGLSIVLFVIGGLLSVARRWLEKPKLGKGAVASLVGGTLSAVAVIVWHSRQRGAWLPVADNFEALLWLAVLLAVFVFYLQYHRPIAGLEGFVIPIVILLLAAAAYFGSREAHEYLPLVANTWAWTHRVTAYGGAVAFAIAASVGAMYVLASRRLRSKHRKRGGPPFESLERLERLTMVSVTLGFALLTIGLVTGLVEMFAHDRETQMTKVVLASLAWLVYAIVLHAPINPRFRGRRAAMLSVFGFVVIFGTLIAVQFAG